MKSKYFENNDGVIELKKDFPKRMTWKRALDLVIEKVEFIKTEISAGRRVFDHGKGDTCACCERARYTTTNTDSCSHCPLWDYYDSLNHCIPIEHALDHDKALDGCYRIVHIKTALGQLYIVKRGMK